MNVRTIEKRDVEACIEIVRKNYSENDARLIKKEMEMSFTENPIKPSYVVAEEDGVIRGYGGFMQSAMSYNVYELFSLNVHPAHQSKGVGKKIMNEIIKRLRKLEGEYKKAHLLILTAASPRLPKYYESLGFRNMKTFDLGKDNFMMMEL
jgi:N-acetylglutamate synthase-like GNAT family acetyltransferase